MGQPRDARHTHCTAPLSHPRLAVGTCRRGRGEHGGAASVLRRVWPGRVCRGTAHIGMSVTRVREVVSAGGNACNARDRDSIQLFLPGLTLGTPNMGRLTQRSQTSIADATSVTQGCHRTGHVHTDGLHGARPSTSVGKPQDARHTHCTGPLSHPRLGVGTCRRGREGGMVLQRVYRGV